MPHARRSYWPAPQTAPPGAASAPAAALHGRRAIDKPQRQYNQPGTDFRELTGKQRPFICAGTCQCHDASFHLSIHRLHLHAMLQGPSPSYAVAAAPPAAAAGAGAASAAAVAVAPAAPAVAAAAASAALWRSSTRVVKWPAYLARMAGSR